MFFIHAFHSKSAFCCCCKNRKDHISREAEWRQGAELCLLGMNIDKEQVVLERGVLCVLLFHHFHRFFFFFFFFFLHNLPTSKLFPPTLKTAPVIRHANVHWKMRQSASPTCLTGFCHDQYCAFRHPHLRLEKMCVFVSLVLILVFFFSFFLLKTML